MRGGEEVSDNDAILLAELERDEGFRAKPYKCTAGFNTVGIGRNLDARGITREEALFLAKNDVELCKAQLDKHLPWWRMLDEVRQRVLINMAFNLGINGLLGFKNTLAAVKAKNWQAASQGMLGSKWADQVGARAQRLAKMMRTGSV